MRSVRLSSPARPLCLAGLFAFVAAGALMLPGTPGPATLAADQAKASSAAAALERIPLDADVFGHLRVAEVYGGPVMEDFRKALGKDAEAALKKFEAELGLPLASVETATFCFPKMPAGPGDERLFMVVVTTVKPYDRDKVLATLRKGKPNGDTVPLRNELVLHLTGERQFAVMHESLVEAYAKGPARAKDGPLAGAIRLAATGKHTAVGGVNLDALPAEIRTALPVEAQPFKPLLDARSASASLDLGKDLTAELRFRCKGGSEAQDAERSWKLLMKLAEQGLNFVLKDDRTKKEAGELVPALQGLLETVKGQQVRVDDGTLVVKAEYKAGNLPVAAMVSTFVGKTRASATRTLAVNQLKQMALALHSYHDAYNGLPPAAICDKRGKPLLSWRVAILPYVGHKELYDEFKLDEPWDSDANKKLLAKMPALYILPEVNKPGDTKTHFRVFTGNGAGFDMLQSTRFADITDGTSNTCMIAEGAEAVEWTKPDELEYDPKKDPRKMLLWTNGMTTVAVFDGSVRTISNKMSERTWHNFIQKADGNPLGSDF